MSIPEIKYPRYKFEQDGRFKLSLEDRDRLIELRKQNISQRKLAALFGVSKTTVAYWTNLEYHAYHNRKSAQYVNRRIKESPNAIKRINEKRDKKKRLVCPEVMDFRRKMGILSDRKKRNRLVLYDLLKEGQDGRKFSPLVGQYHRCHLR